MNGFIYKITNRVNNKMYIGQTRFTVEHRFKQHIKNFNIEHRSQPLYNAFAKYGIENFEVSVLEECPIEKLNEREIFWIAKYNTFKNGYNATLGGKGGCKYFWTDSQYDEIRSMYLSGFTSQKIAEQFNCSAYTIIGVLKSIGIKIKGNPLDMNKMEREEFISWYNNGASLKYLADKYNTDKQTVKRFLQKYGVNTRNHSEFLKNSEMQANAIKDFLSGMKYKDMELKYHTDMKTIKKILVIHGININSYRGLRQTTKGAFCLTDEQCLEVIKCYNDGTKVNKIAKKFNVNVSTIYELLKRYHVKCNRYNHSKSVQTLVKG